MAGARMFRRFGAIATIVSGVLALAGLSAFGGDAPSANVPEPVTFTKHVAPILQQKCQVCHQPNSIAPMSLLTYEDAREVRDADQDESRRARHAAVAHRQEPSASTSSRTIGA